MEKLSGWNVAYLFYLVWARAWGYKFIFMLNSAVNEFFSAYKKLNTRNLNFLPAQQSWAWNFS